MSGLALIAFVLLTPIIGIAIGRWSLRRYPRRRRSVVAFAVLALAAVAACVSLSFLYPGPKQYLAWSYPWAVRQTGLFVVTLPIWVSLAAFHLPPPAPGRRNVIIAAIAGYLSLIVTVPCLVIVGCNQAGACF